MGALLCATAAGRVANGPAHGITRGNRRDRLARLQSNVGDALGGGIEPIERPVAIGIDLHRADESGVRRLAQRGLVGGGDLCGRLGGGGNGKRKDANRQDDGADHGSFLSGVCGGSGSIGLSAGGSGATNSSGLGKRSSGFRTSVSSSRDQSDRKSTRLNSSH